MRWPLVALLIVVAAGCGGTDGKPTAPTTPAPAPAPAPPPEPPTVRAVVQILSESSDPDGYTEGETILALVDFAEPVSVEGSPRLAIEIGDHVRLADFRPWWEHDFPPSRPSWGQRFEYVVAPDDEDQDGISVQADAFDFTEGALLTQAGAEIEVEIYAVASKHVTENPVQVAPGENLAPHRVLPRPPPRVCTDERERASAFARASVPRWNGTPFRADMIRNFPDFVTDADLLELLAPMGRLADQIEEQLGYPVIEIGGLIPVPAGAPPGWNKDWHRYRNEGPLPIEPDQIVAFYLDDYHPYEWDGSGLGAPMNGHSSSSASVSYNKRFVEALWTGDDPCCRTGKNSRQGETIVHEVFHVLGFVHSNDYDFLERDQGVAMTRLLTGLTGAPVYAAHWADIDALRCIFPKEG